MSLHGKIMNIPTGDVYPNKRERILYKTGHRDARHTAAEMALEYDDFVDEVERMMETIVSIHAGAFSSDQGSSYELDIVADMAEGMLDKIEGIK